MAELKADWKRQIRELGSEAGSDGGRAIRHAPDRLIEIMHAKNCVDHALGHSFERASVVHDRRLLESAYRQSIGQRAISLDQITDNLKSDQRLMSIQDRGQTLVTTKEVLSEEHRMVKLARQSRGKLVPLYNKAPEIQLKGQHRLRVEEIKVN